MGWSRWYTPLPRSWGPTATLSANAVAGGRSDLFRQDVSPDAGAGTQAWGYAAVGADLTVTPYQASPLSDAVGASIHMQNDSSEYLDGGVILHYRYVTAVATERSASFIFEGLLARRDYSETLIQDLPDARVLGVDYTAIPDAVDPNNPAAPAYVEFKPGMASRYAGGSAVVAGRFPDPWVQGGPFYAEVARLPNVVAGASPDWAPTGVHLATLAYSAVTGLVTGGLSGPFPVPELLVDDQVTLAIRLLDLDGPWPGFDASEPTDNSLSLEFVVDLHVSVQAPDFRFWLVDSAPPPPLGDCPPHGAATVQAGHVRLSTEWPVPVRCDRGTAPTPAVTAAARPGSVP